MYEIINNKKRGIELSTEEIKTVVQGFTTGEIPDYQMSAWLMAVYFKGMTARETADLTMAMVESGQQVKLAGETVDKHSTGGVGDKTTLIVTPIVAAAGLKVAKMSGRGLGHTGGTIDKLESIPGFRTTLSGDEFFKIVEEHGLCVAGQSGDLAPADKKIYALRDVTATVDSIPLIAASIMSKKIAAGAKSILLDVKTGSGAFMKDLDGATALAKAMVDIGNNCGRKTAALITDMSAPLGRAVGNSLEIVECIEVLRQDENRDEDLDMLCRQLASNMLQLAGYGDAEKCQAKVDALLTSGAALKKFADMVEAQGGDRSYIENPEKFEKAAYVIECPSPQSGYICEMDTEGIGLAAMALGAGRSQAEDIIDFSAGIMLHAKIGDYLEAGQAMATFYTSDATKAELAKKKFIEAVQFAQAAPAKPQLIYDKIGF